jgi:hypothetical protein
MARAQFVDASANAPHTRPLTARILSTGPLTHSGAGLDRFSLHDFATATPELDESDGTSGNAGVMNVIVHQTPHRVGRP